MTNTVNFGLTGDALIDATTAGYKWDLSQGRAVTYSISGGFNGEYWADPNLVQIYVGTALESFGYYANIQFLSYGSYLTPADAAASGSTINVSLDGVNQFFWNNNIWAIGLFPNDSYNYSYYQGAPGDVFLNINSAANSLPSYAPGSEGWFLLIHELGHTVGLKHPHDDGGTGRPTYSQLGIGSLDIDLATIMSYNDDGSWNYFSWDPATPMILDVLALQYLYGKNMSTNAGDSFFSLGYTPGYTTIWDASGSNDSLSLSSDLGSGWTVYLPEVRLSNLVDTLAGAAFLTNEISYTLPTTLTWLAGDIENVNGSALNDTIHTNSLNNYIYGGVGDDVVYASSGNDSLFGSDGIDTVVFQNALSSYTISEVGLGDQSFQLVSAFGTTYASTFEFMQFQDGTYTTASLYERVSMPSAVVSAKDTEISKGEYLELKYTFNKPILGFGPEDFSWQQHLIDGPIQITSEGNVYTARFKLRDEMMGEFTIGLNEKAVTDLFGKSNEYGSPTVLINFDTRTHKLIDKTLVSQADSRIELYKVNSGEYVIAKSGLEKFDILDGIQDYRFAFQDILSNKVNFIPLFVNNKNQKRLMR